MKKTKFITASIVMALYLFTFAVSVVLMELQQASAQNTENTDTNVNANTTAPTDLVADIVSNNGTLNLSNSSLSIQNETVNYGANSQGYLVYPVNATGNNTSTTSSTTNNKLPAVVMVHEWWGLNYNIKNMANELAKEGYVVLAVDLYNGQVASTPEKAMQLVGAARENQNASIANLQSAVRYLSSLQNVDSSKIASMGWCFGGGQALQLALNTETNNPLAATIIYYGNLIDDRPQLSKIGWPVLGIFGSEDQSIPVDQVSKFEESLNALNIPNEIYVYEGVGHGFANPTGDDFAPEETQDAWQKTLAFLDRYLKDNA